MALRRTVGSDPGVDDAIVALLTTAVALSRTVGSEADAIVALLIGDNTRASRDTTRICGLRAMPSRQTAPPRGSLI